VKWCRRERSIVERGESEGEREEEGELEAGIRSSPSIVHAGKAPGNSVGHGKRVVCVWMKPHV